MPATVIVGAQWGDEGKGKIVDLLALDSDLVCRYQGGPNAGHTIVVGDETFKIRQIPSGVIRGKTCVIGAGCVVDPEVLLSELDEFEARGLDPSVVVVSGNAHLIMPWHVAIDQASERRLGERDLDLLAQDLRVEHVLHADADARRLVRVRRADPASRRSDLQLAETPLRRLVDRHVPRHDQVRVPGDHDH